MTRRGARPEPRASRPAKRPSKHGARGQTDATRGARGRDHAARGARGRDHAARSARGQTDAARGPAARRGGRNDARGPRLGPSAASDARGSGTRHGQAPPARSLSLPPRPTELEQRLSQLAAASEPPAIGDWLWATREGAERDCIEEVVLDQAPGGTRGAARARGLAPGLIVTERSPLDRSGRSELTFARQGFPVSAVVRELDEAQLADALAHAAAQLVHGERYALHVFVPDSERGNRLAQRAERVCGRMRVALQEARPGAQLLADAELRRENAELIQVCLWSPELAALGVVPSERAASLWPGGRARMRVSAERPSRAARKLEEALAWLGTAPGPGEVCVDLGAAPGGWTWLLLNRRARVTAVDPARLDPDLLGQRRLSHVQASAFDWHPEEPVDWLFCDMAWRPLEVAQMLGRWARRRQTRMLVANFKLPMKRKAEIVWLLRELLEENGYQHVRTRQLYHDREEITVTARVK